MRNSASTLAKKSMVMTLTWLPAAPRANRRSAYIWTRNRACCCDSCATPKLLSAVPNADRLCGLSQCEWREGAIPLDTCAPRQPIHHSGRAASTECSRGRLQIRHSAIGSTETFDALVQVSRNQTKRMRIYWKYGW